MHTADMARPHAVVVPHPSSGNINPALQLAKLLHRHGFCITFVNTEDKHRRVLATEGAAALLGREGFRFEAIPDGLAEADRDTGYYDLTLSMATTIHCAKPLMELVLRLNATPGVPPRSSRRHPRVGDGPARAERVHRHVVGLDAVVALLGRGDERLRADHVRPHPQPTSALSPLVSRTYTLCSDRLETHVLRLPAFIVKAGPRPRSAPACCRPACSTSLPSSSRLFPGPARA
jgi:hypothetical protein